MALIHSLQSLIAASLPISSPSPRIAIDRCQKISKDNSQTVNANVVYLTRVHRKAKGASHLERCFSLAAVVVFTF